MTLSPGMTIDFGEVEVGDAPVTIALTITNTGDGDMIVASVDPLAAPFSRTDLAATTIPPGGSQTISVTYDPTVERDTPDTATFTITTTGLYAGGAQQPPAILVTVTGRAVAPDVGGGGGCCSSSDGRDSWFWALVVIAAWSRRRRRAAT